MASNRACHNSDPVLVAVEFSIAHLMAMLLVPSMFRSLRRQRIFWLVCGRPAMACGSH